MESLHNAAHIRRASPMELVRMSNDVPMYLTSDKICGGGLHQRIQNAKVSAPRPYIRPSLAIWLKNALKSASEVLSELSMD